MTPEELLKPRYKVIADYPMSYLGIGQVFTVDEANMATVIQGGFWEVDPSKFPALFKKLEWWEDRKEEDMPKYVKDAENEKIVYMVFGWYQNNYSFNFYQGDNNITATKYFIPATKEEYEAQKNLHND